MHLYSFQNTFLQQCEDGRAVASNSSSCQLSSVHINHWLTPCNMTWFTFTSPATKVSFEVTGAIWAMMESRSHCVSIASLLYGSHWEVTELINAPYDRQEVTILLFTASLPPRVTLLSFKEKLYYHYSSKDSLQTDCSWLWLSVIGRTGHSDMQLNNRLKGCIKQCSHKKMFCHWEKVLREETFILPPAFCVTSGVCLLWTLRLYLLEVTVSDSRQ